MDEKRILVYGEGKSNLALIRFYEKRGIPYYIIKEEDNELLLDYSKVAYVVKAPGIPPSTKKYQYFKSLGLKMVTYLEECFKFYPGLDYIVVTGTNGKTTTVKLIYELLSPLNYDYGGNSDHALFDVRLDEVKGMIIEASSFMLRDSFIVHPHIYVITNLSPHHLDFHLSADDYFDSKLKVIKNMTKDDIIIAPYELDITGEYNINHVNVYTFSLDNKKATIYLKDSKVYYQDEYLMDLSCIENTNLLKDVLVMILVGMIYHLDVKRIKEVIESFIPLPHRFQIIVNNNDHVFIDDAKSTSVHALMGALEETNILFSDFQTLLIMGGKDTMEAYELLVPYLKRIKCLYVYGEIKERVHSLFKGLVKIKKFERLEDVMNSIFKDLKSKDLVLFSPGASSLDQFSSFEKRGNIYQAIVRNIYVNKEKE